MKTKNIFKALALAMLMPAMVLTTACSSDDSIINDENAATKGSVIPVTVNVTRQDDATTRATYNAGDKKLEFSAGDKLFVKGKDNGDQWFAGILTWTSGGTFSGTITTENTSYSGTADNLLENANSTYAYLLPAGYDSKGFMNVSGSGYEMSIAYDYTKSFALTKAAAVEQLSREFADTYSNGFALTPQNRILNCTITSLTPSTEVAVSLSDDTYTHSGNVTTDGSGTATFAMGINTTSLGNCTLTVGGNAIALPSTAVETGKIYNLTRSVPPPYPVALNSVTSNAYVGSVVTTDGFVYEKVSDVTAASKTASAIIAYVGTAGSVDASSATYKGLAIGLSNANSGCTWYTSNDGTCVSQSSEITTALGYKNGITCTSTLTSENGHDHAAATVAASNNNGTAAPTGTSGWFLPSIGQWNLIVQGLATKKAGSPVTTDLIENTQNDTYKSGNLNSIITAAGGTGFTSGNYWSSTEYNNERAWHIGFYYGRAFHYPKTNEHYVRSVVAF